MAFAAELERLTVRRAGGAVAESHESRTSTDAYAGGRVPGGCTTTCEAMAKELHEEFGYDPVHVILSDLIKERANEVGLSIPATLTPNDRVDQYQNVGNALRAKFGDEYLADRAIEKIAIERDQRGGYEEIGDKRIVLPQRRVYFLDSLKNPAELRRLRQVYGDLLWVVSVFAPGGVRLPITPGGSCNLR